MYLRVTGVYAVLSQLDYLYAAVAAYFCGCFNGALFTSRLFFHDDVRTHGSGNAGLTTRYVSLGSVCAAAVFPIVTPLVFGDTLVTVLAVCMAALVIWAHRENIRRLLNGTENKFHFHVNAPKTEEEA